jgi:hypothetical protein
MIVFVTLELAPGRTARDFAPCLPRGARAVWGELAGGALRRAHYRTDETGVLLELEVADATAAHALIRRLPMVRAGLIQARAVIPVAPYTGFAGLFGPP